MGEEAQTEEKTPRRVNKVAFGIGAVMAAVFGAGVFFSFQFVEDERARTMNEWQVRLGIVADSRSAAVDEWIDMNFATLRELTENASLQLYMTELQLSEGDKEEIVDEAAQATYLRNLLVATADRTGFKPPEGAGEVNANVERAGVAGIGLVDDKGQPIVSSPGMPPVTGEIRKAIATALDGKPAIIDIYLGATNLPTIGFVLPIYSVQGDDTEGIGAAVGIRTIGNDLYNRLKQPGATEETAETYLVRTGEGTVEYLSPLADGTPPLKRTMALDTQDLAASFALEKPGGFAIKRDYLGGEVLLTSRSIPEVPWVLVRKVTRSEALSGTENRLRTILIVFVLIIVGVAVTIIAVWRHGSSIRAAEAAEKFRIAAERFENIGKFMRVVTNSQPTHIVAVDGTTKYTFANQPAARDAGITVEDMMGMKMASVIGPVPAETYERINTKILDQFASLEEQGVADSVEQCRQAHMHTFGEDENIQVIRSSHVPLRGDRDHPPGVLMVLDDLTDLTSERRKSEKMTRQLINTMVNAVDRRDPYAIHHSNRVAEVAKTIAKEMELGKDDIETVDIAGNLMNLGKIFIPTNVLTKAGDMTEEEKQVMEKIYLVSADLLDDIPFEGPVSETIRQVGETPEGSGPLGLNGDDILVTSQIVAVANAFVDLVTAKANREAMDFEAATTLLLEQAGKRYDRRPLSALINFLENRSGMEKWENFRQSPEQAAAEE